METISSGISPFVWCSLFSKLCMSYPCYWNVMSIKWIRKSSSTFSSACVLTAIWMPLTCANAWRLSERCSMNWRFLWMEPSVWTLSSSLPLLWLLMEFMDSFFSRKSVEVVHHPENDLYSYMQIAWLNHVITNTIVVLTYAPIGSKIGAVEDHVPVASHKSYKLQSCFWHGHPVVSSKIRLYLFVVTSLPTAIAR